MDMDSNVYAGYPGRGTISWVPVLDGNMPPVRPISLGKSIRPVWHQAWFDSGAAATVKLIVARVAKDHVEELKPPYRLRTDGLATNLTVHEPNYLSWLWHLCGGGPLLFVARGFHGLVGRYPG